MYLEEIIDDVQLESDKFECKSILNREDVVGWLKSIAGFANAFGGEFYIGVEDKTNKLIGFERKAADNERNSPSRGSLCLMLPDNFYRLLFYNFGSYNNTYLFYYSSERVS